MSVDGCSSIILTGAPSTTWNLAELGNPTVIDKRILDIGTWAENLVVLVR